MFSLSTNDRDDGRRWALEARVREHCAELDKVRNVCGAGVNPNYLSVSNAELEGLDLSGWRFDRVHFGEKGAHLRDGDFSDCSFLDVRFAGELNGLLFPHASFQDVQFQETTLEGCDLRYARFRRTSFARARIANCDLYRCAFLEGVLFEECHISQTSLHLADLNGSDLRWMNFRISPTEPTRILQEEDAKVFGEFLEHAANLKYGNPQTTRENKPKLVRRRLFDAADFYRRLAGRCSASGDYRDEGRAYSRAKELERRSSWHVSRPFRERLARRANEPALEINRLKPEELDQLCPKGMSRFKAGLRAVGLWLVEKLTGYAESLWRVLATLGGIVLATAIALRASHGLLRDPAREGTRNTSFWKCLDAAIENLATFRPPHTVLGAGFIPVMMALETLGGVAVVGLFGFMLANRIRHA
jgi:uncharacterized protein YjbI with pentapeptide repeats